MTVRIRDQRATKPAPRRARLDIEGAWNDFDGAAAIVVAAFVLVLIVQAAQAVLG
ncbi:hypothetical protein [Prauserella endophytica]|uniref:hypothetical protein n=1 Tax=Prauserella endophytica TaxID=1592324 RepID=UPI00130525F3|nr:hypothetical protein [Prauserella endophytica]